MEQVFQSTRTAFNKVLISFVLVSVGLVSTASAQAKSKDILKDMISLVSKQVSVATTTNKPIVITPQAQKAIVEVQKDSIAKLRQAYPNVKAPIRFDDTICTSATWALGKLGRELKHDSILMFTYERVANTPYYHYYLVFEDILKPGDRYIVDPTIRQFFKKILTKDEISHIPETFVGTANDLKKMFYKALKKYIKEPAIKRDWIDTYLNAEERNSYQ